MREHLLAFIRAVQERTRSDDAGPQFRTTVKIGETGIGFLWFGYGYFDVDKVLWFPPDKYQGETVMSNEDGVDTLLKSYGLA